MSVVGERWREELTPMLSTSILSSPSGPNELFTIFAIDWAAMTVYAYSHIHSSDHSSTIHNRHAKAENRAQSQDASRMHNQTRAACHFGREYPAPRYDRRRGMRLLEDRVGTCLLRGWLYVAEKVQEGERKRESQESGGGLAKEAPSRRCRRAAS
jgi:hypothetical protein